MVQVLTLLDEYKIDDECKALMRTVIESFEEYAKLNEKIGKDLVSTISALEDPARLADTVAAHLAMKVKDKQDLLQIENLNKRLETLFEKLRSESSL